MEASGEATMTATDHHPSAEGKSPIRTSKSLLPKWMRIKATTIEKAIAKANKKGKQVPKDGNG